MIIKGKQICLRDWIIDDFSDYKKWYEPGQKWQETDGPYYPRLNSEELEERINNLKEKIINSSFPEPREDLVIADKNTNKIIGQVNRYWQSKETNWLSLGIRILDPSYWGKGVGYESLGLYCEYLFKEMPEIVRLDLRTWSGNIGMMKLANKLGFKEEACFRKARIVKGEYFDGMGYGILREEWNKKYPNGFISQF